MHSSKVYLLLFAFVLFHAQSTHADTSAATQCDNLAGSPSDAHKVTEGVSLRLIDSDLAEQACKEALDKSPSNPRYLFQYGRIFEAKNDYASAFNWYSKAAEQNYASAQFNLGLMYELGNWVNRDYAKAFSWYQKAAAQNNADAQNNLGVLCRFWPAVQDFNKAFNWFQKAADNGSAIGYFNLGVLYHNGQGAEKNVGKSIAQWRKAAELGFTEAEIEIVFSWAEATYPAYLPGFAEALSNQDMPYPFDSHQYRHYTSAGRDIYLSYNPNNRHLYYSTSATADGTIDLGDIAPFVTKAMAYAKAINSY